MTDWQKIVLATYANGEYEHLFDTATLDTVIRNIALGTNDPLFIFLMDEVSKWNNCKTKEEAQRRLIVAAEAIHKAQVGIAAWREDG